MYRPSITRHFRWPCLLLLILGLVPPARACTIPVFRYAFERWELSPYELVVFHRGELSAGARAAISGLPRNVNLTVNLVDLDGKVSPALQKLWKQQGSARPLPWVVLRRPDAGINAAWSGPLEAAALRQLIDSPARQKMVAALSDGDAGVFLLLQSGNSAADDAAEAIMRRELAKLEKLVKLPEQRGEGPRIRLALPLKVSFTVLPIKRNEPDEDLLVKLLLGTEENLSKVDGPIVFTVFGRGRVLPAMYGKDLGEDNLFFDVVSFLCGECSCQVKELNPGTDLPIAADWTAIFARIGPAPDTGPETPLGTTRNGARAKPIASLPVNVAGVSKPAAVEVQVAVSHYPETPEPMPTVHLSPPAEAPHRPWLWGATIAASLLVVVTGGWVCVLWFRGGPRA